LNREKKYVEEWRDWRHGLNEFREKISGTAETVLK